MAWVWAEVSLLGHCMGLRVLKTCGHSTVDLIGFGAEYHVSREPVIALINTRLVDLHSRAEFVA